jgi:hypothetical protein
MTDTTRDAGNTMLATSDKSAQSECNGLLSEPQRLVIDRMLVGATMMWGKDGPEMQGFPFWPQKRTVLSLIKKGFLRFGDPHNETQRECGVYPVELVR